MSNNPFDSYVKSDNMSNDMDESGDMIQIQESIPDLREVKGEVEHRIITERNESIHDLNQDMAILSETWKYLSSMIYDQGEQLDIAHKETEMAKINTSEGVVQLEKAKSLIKDRLIIVRDIALVLGGGILGIGGFFLGPIVGIGTVIAGGAAGGATAAGIHKLSNK